MKINTYIIVSVKIFIIYIENTQTPKQILADHANIVSDLGIEPVNANTAAAVNINRKIK